MPWTVINALVALLLALGVYFWFRRVWLVMRQRKEALEIADKQRQEAKKDRGGNAEAFAAVLERSENIYRQAVELYNHTFLQPLNWLPAAIMGFRPISDVCRDGKI